MLHLHTALFTTFLAFILALSAAIADSGIITLSGENLTSTENGQNSSGAGFGDAVEIVTAIKPPDPCYLSNVFCDNKRWMRITEYGWTGNKTASGKYPYIGAVATSDRTIPFGTEIIIDGKKYIVEDRTNKRIQNTIDIFSNNPKGLSYKTVYFK